MPPQHNRALIDDLVQQTFLRVCEGEFRVLQRLKGSTEAGLVAYLRTVAAHIAIDHLRRGGPRTEELEANSEQAASDPDDSAVLLAEIDRHLKRCSEENFRRDRRVFWLYHRAGVTAKAIAALPGINLSVKGVESLILRLTRCLRKLFTETPGAGGISSHSTFSMKGRVIGTVS
jgi:RNA polymerase sigma factor (sigma-70 family)